MVSGVNSGYNYNQFHQQAELLKQQQRQGASFLIDMSSAGTYNPSAVGPASTGITANPAAITAADGKDDGSIGFWGAAKNLLKGGIKFFTGMFTDENGNFSLGQTLKTALTVAAVGAVCVLTAGTAVPAILATAGVGLSAFGMAKAGYNIATAETDAEAEAAWQSLGSSTVATGLAVAGAKAVAKSAHAAEAAAGEFDGIAGTLKAVKVTAQDAAAPFSEAFNAVKTGYQIGGLKEAASSAKANVTEQFGQFKTTVKGNYNNIVYGTNTKLADESKSLAKQKEALEQKQAKLDSSSQQYKDIQAKIKSIETKQQAIQDINRCTNWEEANAKIEPNRTLRTQLEAKLKDPNLSAQQKADLGKQLADVQQKISFQEKVLARKSAEVSSLNKQIKSLQEKQGKIDWTKENAFKKDADIAEQINTLTELREKANFKLPSEETIAQAKVNVNRAQSNYDIQVKWKNQYIKENGITDNVDKAVIRSYDNNISTNGQVLADAKAAQSRIIAAGKGNVTSQAASEIGREVYNVFANTKENPTATLLALGIAGRSEATTAEARFVSMLSPQEKAYYQALPYAQKQALIERYVA